MIRPVGAPSYDGNTRPWRQAMACYYGAVTLVDAQVGKIVGALESSGLLEDTIVAFCSDHGAAWSFRDC